MAEKAKTELDEIISIGVDEKNRRIYFGLDGDDDSPGGGFTWESVEVVIRALHKMSMDPKNKNKPIELHMCSYGGYTDMMLRLYDAIQSCPCQIKFYGSGVIMSAATWIMAGCDERYLAPNTQVMVHKWSGAISADKETDIKIEMEHYTGWLTNTLNEIYADNSRMPVEFWEEVTKRDLFLTAEEAIKLGLADAIVPYKKRGNLRRKRIAALSKDVDTTEMARLVRNINKRIQRGKNLKIELHVPEEEFDNTVFVDDSKPEVVEVNEPLIKEALNQEVSSGQESSQQYDQNNKDHDCS